MLCLTYGMHHLLYFLGNSCLPANLRENGCMVIHDIFRIVRTWHKTQSGTCWVYCVLPLGYRNSFVLFFRFSGYVSGVLYRHITKKLAWIISHLIRLFRAPETRPGGDLCFRGVSCLNMSRRPQMGPMLAPWSVLSGTCKLCFGIIQLSMYLKIWLFELAFPFSRILKIQGPVSI